MYAAKRHDKGRFRLFEADMRENARGRIELEADLRHALERAEMVLHFQPTVRLATGVIVGGEALLRWRHPRRGLLPPGAFIALAEETDLIVPIGRFVLDQSCQYAATWPAAGTGQPPRVSVNLSGRQLQRPQLVDEVGEALRARGLPPERLMLEVTQSLPLLETPAMAVRLRELRALGVWLAMDEIASRSREPRASSQFLELHQDAVDEGQLQAPPAIVKNGHGLVKIAFGSAVLVFGRAQEGRHIGA